MRTDSNSSARLYPCWLALLIGSLWLGCTFDASALTSDDGGGGGGGDSSVKCSDWQPVHVNACDLMPPSAALVLDKSGTYRYDTSQGTLFPPMGPAIPHTSQVIGDYRVISVAAMTIKGAATLRVEGDRPLIVAAPGTIQVDGILDASSGTVPLLVKGAGANPADCTTGAPAVGANGNDGAAGGGGGAFRGSGGKGGDGDGNGTQRTGGTGGTAVAMPGKVRGGCPGAAGGRNNGGTPGGGGDGGGAIELVSRTLVLVKGEIRAGGAGGKGAPVVDNGGGGGGSGGYIGLDAPEVTLDDAVLAANGGGGGGGAGGSAGLAGQSGPNDVAAATGGDGPSAGSPGGVGGYREDLAGKEPTTIEDGGGGGGGGGSGYILIFTDNLETKSSNKISPAEQTI